MNESIYDQVTSRIFRVQMMIFKIHVGQVGAANAFDKDETQPNQLDYSILDQFKAMSEIDQFKKENPDNYKIYLTKFLEQYIRIADETDTLDILSYKDEYAVKVINKFSECIKYIIKHLKGLLNPENEVQKTPNPIAPPTGQTVLSQKQSVLLYWYLRENKMISKNVQNQHLAAAIETMTGYKSEQNQEIIRSKETDVWQLGKGNDKVTRNDFAVITSELQKLIEKIKNDGANKTK